MFDKSQINHCSCSICSMDSKYNSKNLIYNYHLKNVKHSYSTHQVCELEKVATLLKEKLKNLKNSRYITQKKNKNLIQQSNQLMEEISRKMIFAKHSIQSKDEIAFEAEKWSQLWQSENGQKILADKRLIENAEQVKIIEKQIDYTYRLIEHKRKIIGRWQNDNIQKIYKDDQIKMLEQENMDMERKMIDWIKVNQRLLRIFEAMKDREVEMIYAAERCKQRNIQAREECSKMQTYILTISKTLDEVFISNTSSSSITLHNEENKSKQSVCMTTTTTTKKKQQKPNEVNN
ncbi:hypothetical protein QQG55_10375 [Brugia pahangi]